VKIVNKRIRITVISGIILLIGLLACIWILIADPNSEVEVIWSPSVNETQVAEDATLEGESIEFGIDGEVTIYLKPTVFMTFGGDIGRISWDEGIMKFEGNAEESARIFFEDCLKPMVDEYIEFELEGIKVEVEIPEVDLIVITASGYEVDPIPDAFIKTRGFDTSEYLQDGRLKLDIEGKIYWIRVEED